MADARITSNVALLFVVCLCTCSMVIKAMVNWSFLFFRLFLPILFLLLVAHSDLLMAIVCDDNDHIFVPYVIWACVYCLWSDRYILIDSSHVIIVCDHCFWCEIMDWSFWAHALFPKITLLNTLLVCDHSWFPLFFDFWVQLCALLFFQLRVMHAKLKSKYNKGHCFLAFQVHLILGLFLMRCWRRRITYVKLFSFTFFLYFVFVTSFLQTLICFFAEQKYSYAAPASSPSAWSPQQEVCSTILFLFPLFFFFWQMVCRFESNYMCLHVNTNYIVS
jgi:hypothetical protein